MNPNNWNDTGKLLLRITLGVLVLMHGLSKLLDGGLGPIIGMVEAQGLPGGLGYAVLIGEVVGPVLLLLGFHARIGAALIAINMLVAIAMAHMGELGTLNAQGGWSLELQGMFLGTAVALALMGPGRFSINRR